MKLQIKLALLMIFLFNIKANSQDFFKDGSMKLTEVSENTKYGFKPKNKYSIKVGEIKNEYAYLNALRGPNGEKINFIRIGSCCSFKSDVALFGEGLLDKYKITYIGISKPIYLYLNGYEYDEPKCPKGFTFVKSNGIIEPITVNQDKIIKTKICNKENMYSVNDFSLISKYGKLNKPQKNPYFEGGIENLKKYFSKQTLEGNELKSMVFRVKIGFVINCKGEAGNFIILTKGKGQLETYANQVLEIVNSMPQQWKPGIDGNKEIDTYQILTFTVISGNLDKVSYR